MSELFTPHQRVKVDYARQVAASYRDGLERALSVIYDGAVPVKQAKRADALIERLFRKAVRMTRVMYDVTSIATVPVDAEIVALHTSHLKSLSLQFGNTMQVRIDDTGGDPVTCHILGQPGENPTAMTVRDWVTRWHEYHPSGMYGVNCFFRRPALVVHQKSIDTVRRVLSDLEFDIIAARRGESLLPEPMCFALNYTDHGPSGEPYGMTLVFDDTWGRPPVAVAEDPAPVLSCETFAGVLVWAKGEGDYITQDVTTSDGGLTWQT
jgi:hypothetical protein